MTNAFVPAFTRSLIRTEERLMICSTCLRCGESRMVSSMDCSVNDWEEGHRCCTQELDQPESKIPPKSV